MVKLSFVIPYYNKEKEIKGCLKSLFNQSLKKNEFEVILVLDGKEQATPALKKIVQPYVEKKGLLILVHSENRGAPAARNTGLDSATGEFISFWDADSTIEPMAAAVWLQMFRKFPEIDFVYAGYRFPEGMGGVPSRAFDAELLKVTNYISGHFPVRRSKCPKWDESLKSLQDWDFWLQVVAAGCKGKFILGYAFQTAPPTADSISGDSHANWKERWSAVREKHGIPFRDTAVCSLEEESRGIQVAKALQADYNEAPAFKDFGYKRIIQIGLNPHQASEHAKVFAVGKDVKKIVVWTPQNIQALLQSPYGAVEGMVGMINDSVDLQFCEHKGDLDLLKRMGFKIEKVITLPMALDDEPATELPAKLRVLMEYDPRYAQFFDSVIRAMPEAEFEHLKLAANADDFTVLLSFCQERSISDIARRMLLRERFVIANFEEPGVDYLDDTTDPQKFRAALIRNIRHCANRKMPNTYGRDGVAAKTNPTVFMLWFENEIKDKEAAHV